jgi:hypothetical protein
VDFGFGVGRVTYRIRCLHQCQLLVVEQLYRCLTWLGDCLTSQNRRLTNFLVLLPSHAPPLQVCLL